MSALNHPFIRTWNGLCATCGRRFRSGHHATPPSGTPAPETPRCDHGKLLTEVCNEPECSSSPEGVAMSQRSVNAHDELVARLGELVRQIDINDFRDSLGHDAKMLAAFIEARALLERLGTEGTR